MLQKNHLLQVLAHYLVAQVVSQVHLAVVQARHSQAALALQASVLQVVHLQVILHAVVHHSVVLVVLARPVSQAVLVVHRHSVLVVVRATLRHLVLPVQVALTLCLLDMMFLKDI
jgi:hypothetical protein